jgi:hypothetical protein
MPGKGGAKKKKSRSKAPRPRKASGALKKAPKWYLYLIVIYNIVGLFLFFTFNQFDKAWFRFATFLDFMIFIAWFVLNIYLIVKFINERYEKKALVLPAYYVAIYVLIYLISGLLAIFGVVIEIYITYWFMVIAAVLEVAYAEFLLRDIRMSKKRS